MRCSKLKPYGGIDARLARLRCKLDKLDEACIHERTIDKQTYERQRDRIREDITLAELEQYDARIEAIDVEGVLAFAEHWLTNAGRIWREGNFAQRHEIQGVIYPNGLPFGWQNFGQIQRAWRSSSCRQSRLSWKLWRP